MYERFMSCVRSICGTQEQVVEMERVPLLQDVQNNNTRNSQRGFGEKPILPLLQTNWSEEEDKVRKLGIEGPVIDGAKNDAKMRRSDSERREDLNKLSREKDQRIYALLFNSSRQPRGFFKE